MPNMEDLLNQISVEITRDRTVQLFLSKIDLDYAYGYMKLSEERSRQCVFALTGGNFRTNKLETIDLYFVYINRIVLIRAKHTKYR